MRQHTDVKHQVLAFKHSIVTHATHPTCPNARCRMQWPPPKGPRSLHRRSGGRCTPCFEHSTSPSGCGPWEDGYGPRQ
eukprot:1178705-Prorocentrum_minimum.AAC.1